jgi:pyruvate ferredoxin oxidoreductase beta subunit
MATTNLKELASMPELLSGGHAACPGCAGPTIIRQALLAAQQDGVHVVASIATGCMEVSTTVYPNSAWRIPLVHSAFENSAATISGVEAAYRSLKRQGKYRGDVAFIAMGGDGGTYDIGLQSLSGALERGHDMVYICYDNEAYMNTGIQRSGATPKGAFTTTAPAGRVESGKRENKKNLTAIAAAHGIPYCAQASPHRPRDLIRKVIAAVQTEGPCFLNVLSPCPRGWRYPPDQTFRMARLAADTCVWPLYEIKDGKTTVNYKPREKRPVREWLESQGRFRHLFAPRNEHIIQEVQEAVDSAWEQLLTRAAADKPPQGQ